MQIRQLLISTSTFALFAITLTANSVKADEVLNNLNDAIHAYQSGDIQETKELLDFTKALLEEKRSNTLTNILPKAMNGWKKEMEDASANSAALAMLGGSGTMLNATYTHSTGKTINLQLMADTPMIAMIAPKFSNPTIMAQLGKVKRVNRQKVILDNEGGLQALIANRFFVQMEGSASQGDMLEYFKLFDIKKLKNF